LSEIQQHHNDLLKFSDRVLIQYEEQKNVQTSFDKMKVWEIKNNMAPESIP